MRKNKLLSPYPILSDESTDYNDGFFTANMETITREDQKLDIQIKFHLSEPSIAEHLENGDAVFLMRLECPLTCYRKKMTSRDETLTMTVPLSCFQQQASVRTYIVAKKDIVGFHAQGFSRDYRGMVFNYPRGSLLAIGPSFDLTIGRGGRSIQTFPDIFELLGDLDAGKSYQVDVDSDTIKIHVGKKVQEFYAAHRPQKYLLTEMLILPAAVEALTQMALACKNGQLEDLSSLRWYQIFSETLHSHHINVEDLNLEPGSKHHPLAVAQNVFQQPIMSAIEALQRLIEEDA